MGRRPKGADMTFLAKMMAEYGEKAGITNVQQVLEEVKPVEQIEEQIAANRHNKMAEVEGILLMQHYTHAVDLRKCKKCGDTFGTNYCYQKYCSPLCRDMAVQEHLGISLAQLRDIRIRARSTSYWTYEEPITMTPATVENLKVFCEGFLAQYEEVKMQAETLQTQKSQQESLEVESFLPETEQESLEQEVATEPSSPGIVSDLASESLDLLAPSPFDLGLDDLFQD